MNSPAVPISTYRLQFNASFTFEHAAAIVDYLAALGVTHCYASSYLKAVPGSQHGYDVTDPTQLNPEVGTEDTYAAWVTRLREHGMGHIIDVVPNHMGIAKSSNPWWQDVLENGPSSRYAPVFDIDWHPLKAELAGKVLLPILGDTYGAVLERQEIQLAYQDGAFFVKYYEHTLPVAPGTYDRLLATDEDALLDDVGRESDDGIEYLSVLTSVRRLPPRSSTEPELVAERDREKEVIKKRLAVLTARSTKVREHLERVVGKFNGRRNDPRSFDQLDALLSAQAYRLAYWRVAAEEINYRRFFDINELAAIRMEDPRVAEWTHAFVFDLVRRGCVSGFRIDHVDGLYDPGMYLQGLQARAREVRPDLFTADRPFFVLVEKILGFDEEMPDWPVHGTTGYDYLVMLNGLFVDGRNERPVSDIYEQFTRLRMPFGEIAYRSKQLILRMSMASELNVLSHQLSRFSERHRHYRDITLNAIVHAIREIIACFPVYRTYVNEREPEVTERDRGFITHAVSEAKRRNQGRPPVVFDFIRDLLLNKADYIPEHEREEHLRFVGKFQQVTSPVTAKGLEDTAFYIYNRLVSLNEVGGEPERFGVAPDALHAWMGRRAEKWPHGLSTTSTHDTKRSEDVRARLNVLSEIPGAWKQAAGRWARLNRRARTQIERESYPSRNEEYLLYQTLLGTWPLGPMNEEEECTYRDRIVEYMRKAMREAKVFTSWLNPSERHEQAMTDFVSAILARENTAFRDDFLQLQRRVARCGLYNSLAQVAIKIGSPGLPDFYQGTELWDFSLVDPDNRRPVDYDRRRALLSELHASVTTEEDRASLAARLASTPQDDRLKLYTITTMLQFRKEQAAIFQQGTYEPLAFEGTRRDHAWGFARVHDGVAAVVIVPRLVATLLPDVDGAPVGERVWGDTHVILPPTVHGSCRHIFTGRRLAAARTDGAASLRLADLFESYPLAVLEAR